MKERPILFSGAMVRAILDGRKTQTRRALTRQPEADQEIITGPYHPTVIARNGDEMPGKPSFGAFTHDGDWAIKCPHGQPGDRLWVRETWKPSIVHSCFDMARDCETVWVDYPAGGEGRHSEGEAIPDEWFMPQAAIRGRSVPSLHMPRWASRLALEITGVRVERLNDCSEADAIAEGVERSIVKPRWPIFEEQAYWKGYMNGERSCRDTALESFQSLWRSINGAGSWEANPGVWVVEFRRVDCAPLAA